MRLTSLLAVLCAPCHGEIGEVYPTLYLLHGAGMLPDRFLDEPIRVDRVADELTSGGTIDPLVLVFPRRSLAGEAFVAWPPGSRTG